MKLTNSISLRHLTFSAHDESEFDERQLEVLNDAINKDINMSKYAKPIYDEYQLKRILVGLENNLNVTYYHNPIFSADQMRVILATLQEFNNTEYEENIVLIAQPQYTKKEMRELVQYTRRPYAKELAKLKLSYDNLKRQIEIIEQVQRCYNWDENSFNFALKVLNKWRDNNNEISK